MHSNYLINGRSYSVYSSLENEIRFLKNTNYLFDLSYLSLLKLSGERASEFLQGQVSSDVRTLTESTMQQGAICNLKGRVMALFDLFNWKGVQLVLPKDLLPSIKTILNPAAMLSRVKLELNSSYQLYGFFLANSQDLLPEEIKIPVSPHRVEVSPQACCYRLSQHLFIIIMDKEIQDSFTKPFLESQQFRGSLGWHYLDLAQQNLQIYPDTRGLFLPHRLGLHLSGHLSFDKGCYKGQEIIARTHYRAKLKHQLLLFKIETNESLTAGKRIFNSTGEVEIGELVDFCPLGTNHYLIAATILNEHPLQVLIESQKNCVDLKIVDTKDFDAI